MADARKFYIEPQLDFVEILRDAKTRWLRPREICEILRNYTRFNLTPDPPFRPPGGSLFLFDRKSLRYFRKDGHNWRKKKDGKTVREAHEKLKFGSVDVLHCYYAHGEDNENFQRRSYWLLDGQMGNIVLVHYRDVNEGSSSIVAQLSDTNIAASSNPSNFHVQTSYASNNVQDWSHQVPYSEYEDVDSGEDAETSLQESMSYSGAEVASSGNCTFQENTTAHDSLSYLNAIASLDIGITSRFSDPTFPNQRPLQNLLSGKVQQLCGISQVDVDSFSTYNHHSMESKLPELPSMGKTSSEVMQGRISLQQPSGSDGTNRIMSNTFLDGHRVSAGDDKKEYQVKEENRIGNSDFFSHSYLVSESSDAYQLCSGHLSHEARLKNNNTSKLTNVTASTTLDYITQGSDGLKMPFNSNVCDNKLGDLVKLDSFGRWMHTVIGKDCDDSLMASDSGNLWNSIDSQAEDQEVSSLSRQMQLDMGSLGPSISQEQLFTIHDFSPDWAYSNVETKVLTVGAFLGRAEPRSIKWSCMFGELEVPAEVLTTNVLRCQAPMHTLGRVPFYVTCSNRLACSEIREFEYRENISSSLVSPEEPQKEIYLQVRLSKLLSTGIDKKKMMCSGENCQKCVLKQKLFPLLMVSQIEWEKIKKVTGKKIKSELIQRLLKGRMYEWLVCKAHEEGKGPNILDEKGQGAIHLAAALGYEWAMAPIVSAGVSPSFRDSRGWTGLHWAAYFGREGTVAELVKLGAAPGAVEDPTSKFPQGQTAADVASSRGHKGIAGYLAEADLISHLSSLTVNNSVMDNVSANLAAEKAIETVHGKMAIEKLNGAMAELSLKESLAAVRNSAQAAARIQAAFRAHSFRRRQLTESKDEDRMMIVSSVSNRFHKINHFNQSLHTAAVRIQQKYRGWKGRKEYLKIRDRIVKIQAHVRGHQVRKQYKKVIWSVGIVEKAILRWRRKRAGLRGFRALNALMFDERKVQTSDEYDFLRFGRLQKEASVEKALARVKSMARNPEARNQYLRLVISSRSKVGYDERSPVQGQNTEEECKARDLDQLTEV